MESWIRREVYVRFGGELSRNLPQKRGKARGSLSHYDAAEGVLTSLILLISEFAPKEQRHIVSVFKLLQDLQAPSGVKGKNQFQLLMDRLPEDHKARWFSGAALNTGEQAMASVMSTVMSRLNAFLDSEMEQVLCFDTDIDAEKFCNEKSALFLVMPEENPSATRS